MQKKSVLLLFSFLVMLIDTQAQGQDTPIGAISYIRQVDIMGQRQYNGKTTLYFNTYKSLFLHDNAPKKDTTIYYEELGNSGNIVGDPTGFPVYKLHDEKKLLFKTHAPQYRFDEVSILSDTFATTSWTLVPNTTKQFGSFTCEKATGHFRGRDYEVWYAPDMPVPSGPFKLGGLPGLIFEARSTDGKVLFLFNSIEISEQLTTKIVFPEGGFDPQKSFAAYLKEIDDFIKKIEKLSNASGGSTVTVSPMETIELNAK